LKKILTTLSILVALLASGTAFAQSASADATASIVASLVITNTADLRFGNIVAGVGATVVSLSTAGVRSGSGNVVAGAPFGAASFTVTGEADSTYVITLPTAAVPLTRTAGAETMTLTAINSDPTGTGLLTAGTQTLLVGGTLNVGAGQVAGDYVGSFNVSVAYN